VDNSNIFSHFFDSATYTWVQLLKDNKMPFGRLRKANVCVRCVV